MAKLIDFAHLAAVFEKNRNVKIPESHWVGVRKMMAERGKQYEAEERAITPTDADMKRRFTI